MATQSVQTGELVWGMQAEVVRGMRALDLDDQGRMLILTKAMADGRLTINAAEVERMTRVEIIALAESLR